MMSTAMKAAFTLTLDDKLSAGLNAISKSFNALREQGNNLTLGKLERGADVLRTMAREVRSLTSDLRGVEGAADRGWAAIKRMASAKIQTVKNTLGPQGKVGGQIGIIGGAVAGYSVLKPIQDYAEYQNSLKHSAITSGKYGIDADNEVARLDKMFRADALAAGQSSFKVAEAYYEILTGGVPQDLLDKVIGEHTRFATAYRVDPKDAGQLSISLLKNMELTPDQYRAALGQTGQISKEGLFKVSGFSQQMPAITGQMKMMGMTGPEATLQALSALQIVRRGTGDDSTAATNLRTLLEHIYAPIQERAMKMHGRQVPDDLRQQVQENAGAWKSAFGVDYAGYMREQEKAGINPLDAYINLIKQLSKASDFTDKMRIFGQLSHSQQAGAAANSLIMNYPDWMQMRDQGRTTGAEVFEKDFAESMRNVSVAVAHLTEAATQLERRAGEGFAPILTPVNGVFDLALGAIDKLDKSLPGLADAVLVATGTILTAIAGLGTLGVVAPAVKAGAALLGGAASLTLTVPLVVIAGFLKLGSDNETPENNSALKQLSMARRSLEGGPLGTLHDGFGPDGRPLPLTLPKEPMTDADFRAVLEVSSSSAPPAPPPQTLDITLHADPGTNATVTRASPGLNVQPPNPGPTTNRH